VAIVGGGLAGLAAAAALVDRGLRITLFESRPRLGGRASSFSDPSTGELVDNCQHVGMGCCTNLADFARRVGAADLFRRERAIHFLSPEGELSTLKAGWLPAPLHLAPSFLRANYLSMNDKLRIAYGFACLRSAKDDRPGESFAQWLLRHRQTVRTINRYWATVLISALNERLEQMDVSHARKVFLDGFLRSKDGYVMEVPTVPLGELYGRRLEGWLAAKGVSVRLTAGVRAVALDADGAVSGIALRSGEDVPADFVVLAVPHNRILDTLSSPARGRLPELERVSSIESSPITGVHFWFDREVCTLPHVVTVGRMVQWVFNHSALQGRRWTDGEGQYLQLVISASYDLLHLDKTSIRDLALAELAEMWPEVKSAQIRRWWVVTEHGATFSIRPGVDALRPPQRTAIDGLFLSGDWTATGWPATMEGAVRAGYLAAEGILEDLGRPDRLIQPDLAPGWLSRWILDPNANVRPFFPTGPAAFSLQPPPQPKPASTAS
jgi:squalene-associated FAD-dependent desaturase